MRLLQRNRRMPRAKTIRPAERYLASGAEEARRLGHSYIGTEHILSVVVCDADSGATRLLARLGVGSAAVEHALACWLPDRSPIVPVSLPPRSTVARVFAGESRPTARWTQCEAPPQRANCQRNQARESSGPCGQG